MIVLFKGYCSRTPIESVLLIELYISLKLSKKALLLSFILIFTWKKNVVLGSMRNLLETKIFVHINETLSAIKEIKIYNKIENFSLDFYSKNKKFYKIRTISGVLNLLPKTFFENSVSFATNLKNG